MTKCLTQPACHSISLRTDEESSSSKESFESYGVILKYILAKDDRKEGVISSPHAKGAILGPQPTDGGLLKLVIEILRCLLKFRYPEAFPTLLHRPNTLFPLARLLQPC